jgi:prepilin-type N-terminal cleavage/methylation domain-containing protein
MHTRRQTEAGFTLVEVVLVMAIAALLVLAAWNGQTAVRHQAEFDESVNRVITAVADARNEAVAGINTDGFGNGTTRCAGGSNPYVFAGTMVVFDSAAASGAQVTTRFWEAEEPKAGVLGSDACEITTAARQINVGQADFTARLAKPSAATGAVLFIRGANSVLTVCYSTTLNTNQLKSAFAGAGCPGGAIQLISSLPAAPAPPRSMDVQLQDSLNHRAHIFIDQSGLPTRGS